MRKEAFMAEKILVVDDSISMRSVLTTILEDEGYDVLQANNGRDALDQLQDADAVKLIITDVNMPTMNGIEFTKQVRKNSNHKFVPIIILTTESEDDMKQQGKAAGATAWIVKPFIPENIIDIINKVTG